MMMRIAPADALEEVRALFREYAESIGFSLDFQGFEEELASLPGRYARDQGGCILVARSQAQSSAGCIAMRRLTDDHQPTCEMKRLYVRPAFTGQGLGRKLTDAIIKEARTMGYRKMRLDTVPSMIPAIALYESLGFRDIAPYTENPIAGTRYLELDLSRT